MLSGLDDKLVEMDKIVNIIAGKSCSGRRKVL